MNEWNDYYNYNFLLRSYTISTSIIIIAVPNVFQIFLTHDKNLLPDDVMSDVKRNIHVWIITDNQWGETYLPVRPPD